MTTIIPAQSWYRPGHDVTIEIDGAPGGASVRVHRLDQVVWSGDVDTAGEVTIPASTLQIGGYGVTLHDADRVRAATAFDVLADAFDRPRYGFVTTLTDDAPRDEVTRFFRRMHLNLAQFYDWAYRHSQLLPPQNDYIDPLGMPRTLGAVNEMADAFRAVATLPLGYSAVYAIASDEVDRWHDVILRREDGEPYRLGEDFLVLVDAGDPRWLDHYTGQLADVMAQTSFAGFHLDQYGWPKVARTAEGRVDLTTSFVGMLERVAADVPGARLVFNNVNDFPTWATATTPQDATYIEVWSPHDSLQDLADLVTRSRRLRPDHPPLISAYLSCLAGDDAVEADGVHAAHLVMASVFAAGGTHLLLGERGHALVDPYYPRNVTLTPGAVEVLATWYDFVVRYGDLLLAPGIEEVTEFFAGGINEDVVLVGADAATKATPGTVWVRVTRMPDGGHVVHLVNLTGTDEVAWDHAKPAPVPVRRAALRVANGLAPRGALWASPDELGSTLRPLDGREAGTAAQTDALSAGQEHREFALPDLTTWAVIWLPVD